jgi:hypothetical protein
MLDQKRWKVLFPRNCKKIFPTAKDCPFFLVPIGTKFLMAKIRPNEAQQSL